ncbi:YaaA family protein [Agromyces ramosus]|uniref:Cytoplasmic iron level regulating protein YaaA (DUF328/UPF0246 family) n=1 Tax=Agromyces ramosus TaxID=33879 RepID=A0ABU0RBU1_9MICO|nr:peroxide stress protein YaaA [Agromyces ramosus]MDQ0895540.1 cytoplasmic iron level regulating protein YaaA (DUF328/UPF0246 family) [Agromyces ramosus]
MLVLLPPSETKRAGGSGAPLDLEALSFRELTAVRATLVDATVALAADPVSAVRALKLSHRQSAEVERNRVLRESPTMPALDRFTGVLYDALDAGTLDDQARRFAHEHVSVHSALFGLVSALDPIPAYRLSHDSRLPGVGLRRAWRGPVGEILASRADLIVDLRSEAYVDLGPAAAHDRSVFVRVVAVDEAGRRRALNHFNKRAKGLFTRAMLESRPTIETLDDLLAWAGSAGIQLKLGGRRDDGSPRELELVA